jgi:tetratricopeptide (TPR) repeat protein
MDRQLRPGVAEQVIERLGVTLLEPESLSLEDRPTDNMEAYDYYLKGNEYFHRAREVESRTDGFFAVQMYESAIGLDASFASALAKESAAHSWIFTSGLDTSAERLSQARALVDRALALNPDLPEAHTALGAVHAAQGRRQQALQEYRIALSSQPSSAEVYEAIGHVQQDLGLWADTLASMERAAVLNPRFGRLSCWAGGAQFGLRHFEEALDLHERAIDLAPDRSCPYVCMADIFLNADGNTDRARDFLAQLPSSIGLEEQRPINYSWVTVDMMDGNYQAALDRQASGATEAYAFMAYYVPKDLLAAQIYGLMGQGELERTHYEAARDLLEEGLKDSPDDPRLHGSLGVAYAGLGQRDSAILEGRLALELLEGNEDEKLGFRIKDLAQIYTLVGEEDAAVDELERLVSIPAFFNRTTWRSIRRGSHSESILVSRRSSQQNSSTRVGVCSARRH